MAGKKHKFDWGKELKSIPWKELSHAYGDASDIPDAILSLRSQHHQKRGRALRYLQHSVYHQGFGEYTAMPYVPAFLIRLLQDPLVKDKGAILKFLALLSEEHRWYAYGLWKNLQRPNESIAQFFTPPVQEIDAQTYQEVCKGIPVYIDLLSNSDKNIRIHASYLLVWLQESAKKAFEPIKEQLEKETRPLLIAHFRICLGLLLRHLGKNFSSYSQEQANLKKEIQRSKNPVLRAATFLALALMKAPTGLSLLVGLQRVIVSLPYQRQLPWNNGNVAGFALNALLSLHKTQSFDLKAILAELLDSIAERNDRIRSLETAKGPGDLLETALFYTFPAPKKSLPRTWPLEYDFAERRLLSVLKRYSRLGGFGRKRALQVYQLGTHAFLEEKNSFNYFSPLDEKLSLSWGKRPKTKSIRQWWNMFLSGSSSRVKTALSEFAKLLSSFEIYTIFEYLLEANEKVLYGETSRNWMHFLAQELPGIEAASFALREKVHVLLTWGCLNENRGKRFTYQFFAHLLATDGMRYPKQEHSYFEEKIESLLAHAPEVFEVKNLEELRVAISFLSLKKRRRMIDKLKVTSFAEPDEAWGLYDLYPCVTYTKRLLRLMPKYEAFFSGAGAWQAMWVLAAQGEDAIPFIQRALSRKQYSYRHVLAASMVQMQHKTARTVLGDFQEDKDSKVSEIARFGTRAKKQLSPTRCRRLGIDPGNSDVGNRAKGGVVGVDGKAWRGETPRFRP